MQSSAPMTKAHTGVAITKKRDFSLLVPHIMLSCASSTPFDEP
jgi:hypothetical protein